MAKLKNSVEPEDEPVSFRDLLIEQIRVIWDELLQGRTFDVWYSEHNCSLGQLAFGADLEAAQFALGYLRGAHEALDVTMSEMFDEWAISMEQRP